MRYSPVTNIKDTPKESSINRPVTLKSISFWNAIFQTSRINFYKCVLQYMKLNSVRTL